MNALPVISAIGSVLACILVWELAPTATNAPDVAAPRRAPAHAEAAASPGANAASGRDADLLTDVANTVLVRPLFSPGRRLAAPAVPSAPDTAPEDVPRLTGIIIGPVAALAIFDVGSSRPRIATEGDTVGRFKVGTIAPDQVALIASEGALALRPRFAQSAGVSRVPLAQTARPAR
jgi:hypothetical protein